MNGRRSLLGPLANNDNNAGQTMEKDLPKLNPFEPPDPRPWLVLSRWIGSPGHTYPSLNAPFATSLYK